MKSKPVRYKVDIKEKFKPRPFKGNMKRQFAKEEKVLKEIVSTRNGRNHRSNP